MIIFRRVVTIGFWPIIDLVVTVFSHFMLFNFGVYTAVLASAGMAIFLNIIFFHLLLAEKEVSGWAEKQGKKIKPLYSFIRRYSHSKSLAVLIVYTLSGPAMAGAPFIWLLKIRGVRAYFLIVVGIAINSLLWTGLIYGTFWRIVRGLI